MPIDTTDRVELVLLLSMLLFVNVGTALGTTTVIIMIIFERAVFLVLGETDALRLYEVDYWLVNCTYCVLSL